MASNRVAASRRTPLALLFAVLLCAAGLVPAAASEFVSAAESRYKAPIDLALIEAAGLRGIDGRMDDLIPVDAAGPGGWWESAHVVAIPPVVEAVEDEDEPRVAPDAEASDAGWVHPLPTGRFASAFGYRAAIPGVTVGGLHNGIDIAAPLGHPIRAASAGTVLSVTNGSGQYGGISGWVVAIDHGDGIVTTYNHMSRNGVLVAEGEEVLGGAIIAVVGNEGRSTGPHLHFTVHIEGNAVDPVVFMRSRGIDLESGTRITPVPLTDDWLEAQEKLRAGAAAGPAPTPKATPTPTPTPMPMPTPTESASPTPTPGESASPTPTPGESASPTPTPGESASPTPTPGESASPTPTPGESATPTPTPTAPATPTPTPTESAAPTPNPTSTSSETPTPVFTPSPEPGETGSASPSPGPDTGE